MREGGPCRTSGSVENDAWFYRGMFAQHSAAAGLACLGYTGNRQPPMQSGAGSTLPTEAQFQRAAAD